MKKYRMKQGGLLWIASCLLIVSTPIMAYAGVEHLIEDAYAQEVTSRTVTYVPAERTMPPELEEIEVLSSSSAKTFSAREMAEISFCLSL